MTRVLSSYRLKIRRRQTRCEFGNLSPPNGTTSALLTFTGGAVESLEAQLTGHTPKTHVTGAGAITQVAVITFTAVTAGGADSTRTDWSERMMSSMYIMTSPTYGHMSKYRTSVGGVCVRVYRGCVSLCSHPDSHVRRNLCSTSAPTG